MGLLQKTNNDLVYTLQLSAFCIIIKLSFSDNEHVMLADIFGQNTTGTSSF